VGRLCGPGSLAPRRAGRGLRPSPRRGRSSGAGSRGRLCSGGFRSTGAGGRSTLLAVPPRASHTRPGRGQVAEDAALAGASVRAFGLGRHQYIFHPSRRTGARKRASVTPPRPACCSRSGWRSRGRAARCTRISAANGEKPETSKGAADIMAAERLSVPMLGRTLATGGHYSHRPHSCRRIGLRAPGEGEPDWGTGERPIYTVGMKFNQSPVEREGRRERANASCGDSRA
jgi:hypothetical protein